MEVSHTSLNWNIQTKRINIINYTFIIGITYNLQGDIRASLSTYMHHISTLHAYITMAVTFIAILFFHSDCHCQVQLKSTIESSEQIDWCMVKFQGKVLIIAHIKFRIYKIWLYVSKWHVFTIIQHLTCSLQGKGGRGVHFCLSSLTPGSSSQCTVLSHWSTPAGRRDSMNGATSKPNSSTNTCQTPVTSGHMPG